MKNEYDWRRFVRWPPFPGPDAPIAHVHTFFEVVREAVKEAKKEAKEAKKAAKAAVAAEERSWREAKKVAKEECLASKKRVLSKG